jgi:hypothetical protein
LDPTPLHGWTGRRDSSEAKKFLISQTDDSPALHLDFCL